MSEALLALLQLAQEEEVATGSEGFGLGAAVLLTAMVALLVWMGYLFVNSRRSVRAGAEPTPVNQAPYLSDDELENERTTKVLRAAVFAAAALAIVLPWYAFTESDRLAEATDELDEAYLEEGLHWFQVFECVNCHGADLGGGVAEFVEPRTGVLTQWAVPSLNDVLYRYDESEVRFVIEYGRQGTPMPPAGLAGGGSMSVQEVDQVIAYIRANQLPQADVVAKTERLVPLTVARIENGAESTQVRINQQQARIDEVSAAPALYAEVGGLADDVLDLLGADGTCTEASAELALTTCDDPGLDTDRDGLTDAAERQLTDIAAAAYESLTTLSFNNDGTANPLQQDAYDVVYDPGNAFSNINLAGRPVADLDTAEAMLTALQGDLLILEITATKQDDFLEPLQAGMVALEEAAALMLWTVDYAGVAADMGVSLEEATRAVGLFNGYCARCHSGGYSAGVTFEIGPGRGAWGPAINDGRAIVQFPDFDDHVEFIVEGSDNAAPYGVNGIGTGRMPGFGTSLTPRDIELIAMYERTL